MSIQSRFLSGIIAILIFVPSIHAQEAVLRHPSLLALPLNTVCWTGSQFVAAGDEGLIMTSPDGVSWTQRVSPAVRNWYSSAAGGGTVILGGVGRTVISSQDGITWVQEELPFSGTAQPSSITITSAAYHDGKFYLSSLGPNDAKGISTRTGGNWTLQPSTLSGGSLAWQARTLAPGQNSLVSGSQMFQFAAWTASDWQLSGEAAGVGELVNSLLWTGTRYVAVGDAGKIASSLDGTTWTLRTSGITTDLKSLAWNGSLIAAVGADGNVLTSPNGATWTTRASSVTIGLRSVASSGAAFVAVGELGGIIHSTNGETWTTVKAPSSAGGIALNGTMAWTPGLAVAAGEGGTVYSSDGVTWIQTPAVLGDPSPRGTGMNRIAFSGSRIVVSGNGHQLWSAPLGLSAWTTHNIGAASVVWDGSSFSAWAVHSFNYRTDSCYFDALISSLDGVNWNPDYPYCSDHWGSGISSIKPGDMVYYGGNYIRGKTWSQDKVTWQDSIHTPYIGGNSYQMISTPEKLYGVYSGSGLWSIYESTDGKSWQFLLNSPGSSVEWTGTHFVTLVNGKLYRSVKNAPPETNWQELDGISGMPESPVDIAYMNDRLLVLTANGRIYSIENLNSYPGPVRYVTKWADWQAYYFTGTTDPAINGPDGDPDKDAVKNLLEFALGTDPLVSEETGPVLVQKNGNSALFTWREDKRNEKVAVIPQVSDDLEVWDNVSGEVGTLTAEGLTEMSYSTSLSGRRFFRLSAAMLPQ